MREFYRRKEWAFLAVGGFTSIVGLGGFNVLVALDFTAKLHKFGKLYLDQRSGKKSPKQARKDAARASEGGILHVDARDTVAAFTHISRLQQLQQDPKRRMSFLQTFKATTQLVDRGTMDAIESGLDLTSAAASAELRRFAPPVEDSSDDGGNA